MRKCTISTRIAAILLAAGMVAGDTVPALAVQTSGAEVKTAEVVEMTETVETDTEEMKEAKTETEESVKEEAAETVAETETVETEETETDAEENETEIDETREGRTEAQEETESIEEAAEAAEENAAMDVTVDDVVLGDEIGVSTVIGLEGKKGADGVLSSDDKKIQKEYTYINKTIREDWYITIAGEKEEKLDAATGLYKYNDNYYAYGSNYSNGTCRLSEKVTKIQTEMPKRDEETGLYLADGKYYAYYSVKSDTSGKVLCFYFSTYYEADFLGMITASNTQEENAALEEVYGKKLAEQDASACYYEANGKKYTYIETRKIADKKYAVYARKGHEFSFIKHHQKLTWKSVTNPTEISANGKMYYIGYQIKINGRDAELGFETADGQTFTRDASFTTAEVFDAGVQNIYEVRAIYYTKSKTAVKDAEGVVSYQHNFVIAKTGAWSSMLVYANEGEKQLQEVPAVTNLTVLLKKNNRAELNWDEIAAASYYRVYAISSDAELTVTDEMWKKAYTAGKSDVYDEEGNFLYKTAYYDASAGKTYMNLNRGGYQYNYYRVKAYIKYENDTYKTGFGEASNVVTAAADAVNEDVTPITGFYAEAQTDGSYKLKWDELPSDTKVYIFRSQYQDAFANDDYLLGLIDAEGTYVYDAETDAEETVSYISDDAVAEAYEIASGKTSSSTYAGNEGIGDGVEVEVPANKKYYFVAVTVGKKNYKTDRSAATPYVGSRLNSSRKEVQVKYGSYNDVAKTSVISLTGILAKPNQPEIKSEKDSITMTFSKQSGVTGFEIYKKNSKGKYKKLTATTSVKYTDKELKENTTYSYKVRAYVYNTVTKKKTYSEYAAFSAETSTNNYIDVTASMIKKNAVKVKWTRVAGALRYEVYRSTTVSTNDVYSASNKYGLKSNAKWKLVKTINDADTVSYTDKKLNEGETYHYRVAAYFSDGKNMKTIYDSDAVTLQITAPVNVKAVLNKSKIKVTWDKNSYAKKYEVKYTKYNSQGKAYTDEPVVVSTKKTTVSITGLKSGEYVNTVQVRAYDGKKWSDWSKTSGGKVSLAAVKGVTAKNITEKDANGVEIPKIEISWKAVSGAAYYMVYRSTSPAKRYNKDTKGYHYTEQAEQITKESNLDENKNAIYYDDYKNQIGTIVGTKAVDAGQQLQNGVTYYYFVVAFSENGKISSYGYANEGAKVVYNAAPTIKSAKAKKGKVTISFDKVTGAKKYVVYRSAKKKTGYTAIGTTKKTSFVDKKAKKGTTYYYKVEAVGTNALKADFRAESSVVKVKAK